MNEIKYIPLEPLVADPYIGVCIVGHEGADKFWRIECPCGEVVHYAINKLPTEDVPMPCGNPEHWAVKYYKE